MDWKFWKKHENYNNSIWIFFLFREEIKFQIEQNAMTAPTNDEHGLE